MWCWYYLAILGVSTVNSGSNKYNNNTVKSKTYTDIDLSKQTKYLQNNDCVYTYITGGGVCVYERENVLFLKKH